MIQYFFKTVYKDTVIIPLNSLNSSQRQEDLSTWDNLLHWKS